KRGLRSAIASRARSACSNLIGCTLRELGQEGIEVCDCLACSLSLLESHWLHASRIVRSVPPSLLGRHGAMNPAGRVRCKHAAEIKLLCQLLQLKLDRRRCSIGHHASAAAALWQVSTPPAREPRRVGACSVSARDKKPRLGRGLKCHLPEGNKPIACTTGRTTMRSSAAPVTRCFGRSTNRPVLPASKPFQQPKRGARKAPPKAELELSAWNVAQAQHHRRESRTLPRCLINERSVCDAVALGEHRGRVMRHIATALLATTAVFVGLAQSASAADMRVPYKPPA